MAQITRLPFARHLRSDPSHHVLHYRDGRLVKSGRGLSYWFLPMAASIAEIPCDDRELAFLFHARTSDFQDVTTQGVITYRIVDPEKLAARVDFSIDAGAGVWKHTPLEQLGNLLTQIAQQLSWEYTAHTPVRTVLAEGMARVCEEIRKGLDAHASLAEMGLAIVAVRLTAVSPTPELEKALQTPTRESIQQQADEATFQRRALAVEKERAIQENELQNKIELAKRQQLLIEQEGQNGKRLARERAESDAISAEANAARLRLSSAADADAIRIVQQAKVAAEKSRVEVYRDLPSNVLLGLAARRFAGKVQRIDRLNVGPEMLGSALADLVEAGARKLGDGGRERKK